MKIYLASPLGFSEVGRTFYSATLVPLLEGLGHEVIDPWSLTPQSKIDQIVAMPYGPQRREAFRPLNFEVGYNNRLGIDRAQAVFAVLDGVDVDSGTASEIGYAFGRGIPIVGYRGDFRLSTDNEGSTVNSQVQYFILASGGKIVTKLSEVPEALAVIDRKTVAGDALTLEPAAE